MGGLYFNKYTPTQVRARTPRGVAHYLRAIVLSSLESVCVLVDDALVNAVSLYLYLSVSLSLCLPCVHDMATVSQSPPPLPPPLW